MKQNKIQTNCNRSGYQSIKRALAVMQLPIITGQTFLPTPCRAISVILGDKWKKMKSEERRMYTLEAKVLAEEQKRLNPDCWKRKRTNSVSEPAFRRASDWGSVGQAGRAEERVFVDFGRVRRSLLCVLCIVCMVSLGCNRFYIFYLSPC